MLIDDGILVRVRWYWSLAVLILVYILLSRCLQSYKSWIMYGIWMHRGGRRCSIIGIVPVYSRYKQAAFCSMIRKTVLYIVDYKWWSRRFKLSAIRSDAATTNQGYLLLWFNEYKCRYANVVWIFYYRWSSH